MIIIIITTLFALGKKASNIFLFVAFIPVDVYRNLIDFTDPAQV